MKLELTELQAEMLRRLDNSMMEAMNCGLGDILDSIVDKEPGTLAFSQAAFLIGLIRDERWK